MLPPADELLVQLSAPDRHAAAELCAGLVESGSPLREVVETVLAPAMAQVGSLWQAAVWSVADEHLATGVADTALTAAAGWDRRRGSGHGEILVACVEGDWHSLAARMVAEVLDSEGWSVRFLGASHPTSALVDYVRRHRPTAVLLSCTVPRALPALVCAVQALHELGTRVVVGGRALGGSPHRAAAVGADGWAASAPTSALLTRPIVASAPTVAFGRIEQYRELQQLFPAWSAAALRGLAAALPAVAEYPAAVRERMRADLQHVVDMAGIGWLLDDESLVAEQCRWLADVLAARGVPDDALPLGLTALLETEPPVARVAGLGRHLTAARAALA